MFLKKIPFINNKLFWKYLLVSVVATIVDISLLFSLTEFANINYLISATISFCMGTLVAYLGQKYHTFKDTNKNITKQLSIFIIIAIIGLLINLVILKIAVSILGLYYIVGKLFAIGFGFIWNYSINKRITFKKGKT